MSETNHTCALRVNSEMLYLTPVCKVKNEDVLWLLENFKCVGDPEIGVEEVKVAVKASEDGTVYDILLNERSLGYLGLKNVVNTLPKLKMPDLVCYKAEFEDAEQFCEDLNYNVYFIPMIGDAVA